MAEAPDFAAEGLLDGLEEENERAARLELLEKLHADGVSLEELRQAVEEERLVLLPVERVLSGEPRYTASDLAREAGVDPELLARQRRAMGLPVPDPEARAYGETDLAAARRAAAFTAAGFPEEASMEILRVVGASMARVAQAMRGATAEALARPGDTERDLGLRLAEFAEFASENWGDLLSYVLEQHLLEQVRGDVITRAEAAAGRSFPARRRSASPSRTSWASPAWASVGPSMSLVRWPSGSPNWPARWPSRPCSWSRRSATRPCSCHPSPGRCLTPRWAS